MSDNPIPVGPHILTAQLKHCDAPGCCDLATHEVYREVGDRVGLYCDGHAHHRLASLRLETMGAPK